MSADIQELIKNGADVSVTIKTTDLINFADYLISRKVKALEEVVINDKAESYMTPRQVSEKYNVNLSTLWRWNKKGYLTTIEFGGSRRYRTSAVKAILNSGKEKAK
ncbi:MAG TPA: DNA-binding protein [Prolixibacteraceae bacterium]|nr:DNA-binding protein [Prolixibacteraceae bacterium]